ncbi:MAG TPA: histidinol-phosphate transaminase [Lacipirellulaceae bacterium]
MPSVRPNIAEMQGYVPGEQPPAGTSDKLIKLNTNENPYQCSPKVKAAIGRVVQQGLQKYPDPLATAFRVRAAELLGVDPDWILCGNGSDDILTIVTRAFVGTSDMVRFANPSYLLYRTLAEIQGAACDIINYNPDWSLPEAFSKPSDWVRLVYLANPNSPSGTMVPPKKVAEIAAALPCPVLVDEAYCDFADVNCISLVAENDKVMVARTLSKSYALAGLRFGYLVAQPEIIRELRKVKDSYNCDALSIAGATAAIDDQTWLAETRAAIVATRDRMTPALRELGFAAVDSQANFVWAPHETTPVEPLYRQLKDAGILVRYMRYPEWGDGLRISVGTDEQVDGCLAALRTML